MGNLTEWIKYNLYPSLFEHIDRVFPEHNFKRFAGGWRSSLKIDLSKPKEARPDKTVVTKRAPYCILEQGGDSMSLVNYVVKRDVVEFINAVKTLANAVGLKMPDNLDFNREDYHKYKDQATILECCNSYFIWCLENATGSGAAAVSKYLSSREVTAKWI